MTLTASMLNFLPTPFLISILASGYHVPIQSEAFGAGIGATGASATFGSQPVVHNRLLASGIT